MDAQSLLQALMGGGGQMGGGFNPGLPRRFSDNFRCYSVAVLGRPEFEEGDKVVLPPSALAILTQLDTQYPMMFHLSNSARGTSTHCGVLEFIAEEGRAYLPHWVMENLALEEGQFLQVTSAKLPNGTFVKFRPHKTDFIQLSNPKAVLERHLPKFSCLTKGDTIVVPYQGKKYAIDILELKPSVRLGFLCPLLFLFFFFFFF